MRIGPWNSNERVLVVAEIGNNHEGDPAVARELVHAAAGAGAHAVKLQTFDARRFVRPSQPERLAQLARYQLPAEEVAALAALARELGLGFLSTPLDLPSVDLLEPLVDALKIASGDNDVPALLERIADTGKPVIVSSGMSDLAGVRAAKEAVERRWSQRGAAPGMAVLHCVSIYPAPPERASLATIPLLARELGCTVGYSDHTLGIEACVVAAAAGARILEKHVTLRHDFSAFRDHQLSAEPSELRELVARVAEVERLLGTPRDGVLAEEEPTAQVARRSIVAAVDLPAGHLLGEGDLTWMRPLDGLRPGQEALLLGRALRRDVAYGEPIRVDDVA